MLACCHCPADSQVRRAIEILHWVPYLHRAVSGSTQVVGEQQAVKCCADASSLVSWLLCSSTAFGDGSGTCAEFIPCNSHADCPSMPCLLQYRAPCMLHSHLRRRTTQIAKADRPVICLSVSEAEWGYGNYGSYFLKRIPHTEEKGT